MTANELANKLADEIKTMLSDSESYYGNAEGYLIKAEAKLRQQQAEIEALKQQVAFLEDWRDTWSPTIKQLMNINIKVQEK